MDNTREKLIELLEVDLSGSDGYEPELIADHLIANGVTVQKWIPVTERLPRNDTYILVSTDCVVIPAYWHNDRFYSFTAIGIATVGGVTHWVPLPEPPKGDEL